MRRISLFAFIAVLIFALASCSKQCYDCEKYTYSYCYTASAMGYNQSNCYDTREKRDAAYIQLANSQIGSFLTIDSTDTLISYKVIEICDKKTDTEKWVEDWEAEGYTCTLKQ